MSLAEVRAKLEAAQAEGRWDEGQRLAHEALQSAGAELAAARRRHDVAAKMSALDLVVRLNMFLGNYFAASLAANDEIAMIRRTGDAASEAEALLLLSEVQAGQGDAAGAAESLRSAVQRAKEAGDKAQIARCSRSLALALLGTARKGEAVPFAEEAVKLYRELGDPDGEAGARRALNLAFVEKGRVDLAPDREEALRLLKDLSDAVVQRDSSRWTSAMESLDKLGAHTQKDVDDVVSAALEKDRPVAALFLEDQGIVPKGTGVPQTHIKELNKRVQYLEYRIGGLGYGPRFRCSTSYKKQTGEDIETLAALSCLQVSEEAEEWEADLQFHPGILDGMLQSGKAYYA